jgi:hypothetical protein
MEQQIFPKMLLMWLIPMRIYSVTWQNMAVLRSFFLSRMILYCETGSYRYAICLMSNSSCDQGNENSFFMKKETFQD